MRVHEIVETDSQHLLNVMLNGIILSNIFKSYEEERRFLSITGKKKDKFSNLQMKQRIKQIDEYQEKLDILRRMIINEPHEEKDFYPIRIKMWAIEKYNNFTNERKRLGI